MTLMSIPLSKLKKIDNIVGCSANYKWSQTKHEESLLKKTYEIKVDRGVPPKQLTSKTRDYDAGSGQHCRVWYVKHRALTWIAASSFVASSSVSSYASSSTVITIT